MLTVTAMGIFVLGLKAGAAIISSVGIVSGVHWFNSKKITSKRGGSHGAEGDIDSEKFHRSNL